MSGYYRKLDKDSVAWDVDPGSRWIVGNAPWRRKLRKKLRRKLRKTLDKEAKTCYNEYNKSKEE